MSDNLKISGALSVGTPNADVRALPTKAKGTWRGQSLSLAAAGAAHAAAQSQNLAVQALPAVQVRDVLSRTVVNESSIRALPPAQLFQRAQTQGLALVNVRAQARAILSDPRGALARLGQRQAGPQPAKTRFMALQLAAACLEDGVTDDDVAAMLMPVRGGNVKSRDPHSQDPHSQESVAELVRRLAADDGDEFKRFLEDVLAGADDRDGEELRRKLQFGNLDDRQMMELLRSRLRIPQLHQQASQRDLELLRQKVHDEIHRFASEEPRRHESEDIRTAEVLPSFNAAAAAAGIPDSQKFLDTYVGVVTVPRDVPGTMKFLVSRYPIDALTGILEKLQQALADDLSAATPSRDARRLGAVLTELGTTAVLSSLIAGVKDLVALMRRTGHAHG